MGEKKKIKIKMQIKTHNSNFKVQTKTTISTEQNISKY